MLRFKLRSFLTVETTAQKNKSVFYFITFKQRFQSQDKLQVFFLLPLFVNALHSGWSVDWKEVIWPAVRVKEGEFALISYPVYTAISHPVTELNLIPAAPVWCRGVGSGRGDTGVLIAVQRQTQKAWDDDDDDDEK